MWLLTVEDYEGLTTCEELSGERYSLGRAPDSDVLLAQYNVSRRHARLEFVGERWFFFDEGSDNGSYHNGRRVAGPTVLSDGDVLQVGDYVLRFSKETGALEAPPARPSAPARLRVLAGLRAGTEYTFRRSDLITIGSADDCALRLEHKGVEALHAIVRALPGGRYGLVDKSRDGSLSVNGRPVAAEQVLEGGDSINVAGVSLLRYLEPSQVPDPRFDGFLGEGVPMPPPSVPPTSGGMLSAKPVGEGAAGGLAPTPSGGTSVLNQVPDVGGEWDVTALFRRVMSSDRIVAAEPAGDVGAEGDEPAEASDSLRALLPAQRFEEAGPLTPPGPRPLPTSYLRLRQTMTPARGTEGRGRGQAAAAVRRALELADEGLAELQRWQSGAKPSSQPPGDGWGSLNTTPTEPRRRSSPRPPLESRPSWQPPSQPGGPSSQPPGEVTVGGEGKRTKGGARPESGAPTSAPRASDAPRGGDAARASGAPKASGTPRASGAPKASDAPRASGAPKASDAPRASGAPKASDASRASGAPKSSEAPRASGAPKAPASSRGGDAPSASDKAALSGDEAAVGAERVSASEAPVARHSSPPPLGRGRVVLIAAVCLAAAAAAAIVTVKISEPGAGERGPAVASRVESSGLPLEAKAAEPGAPVAGSASAAASAPAAVSAPPDPGEPQAPPAAVTGPEAVTPPIDRRQAHLSAPARGGETPADRAQAKALNAQRARLESRALRGRASPDELQMLLGMCQREGDTRCIVDTSARLRRIEGGR